MGIYEIKGLRLGEGRPKAIVSLMDTECEGLVQTYEHALNEGADLLEWRADFWPAVHDQADVVRTCLFLREQCAPKAPFIFTCRTKGQGGNVEMDHDESVALLTAVISKGKPDFVDIELDIGDDAVRELVQLAHEHDVVAIVSHHDFAGTPSVDDMQALLWRMIQLGADIPKLAVMAQRSQDAHDLMRASHLVYEQAGVPLLTLAMGTAGQNTRLTGEIFGSSMTFCALDRPSAPGQVELKEAIVTMDAVHRQVS